MSTPQQHPVSPPTPYATPAAYGTPTPPRPNNALGGVALLVALGTAVLGLAWNLVIPLLIVSGRYAIAEVLALVIDILLLVGGATALTLGLIALRRPAPHVRAAIAVGIGGAIAISALIGLISSMLHGIAGMF